MKKIFTTLSLALAFAMSLSANVRTITDGNYEFEIDTEKGTATLTRTLDTSVASITLPRVASEGSTKYLVNALGNNALNGCSKITSLVITDNITAIYRDAFTGCTSLTSVTFAPGTATLAITSEWGAENQAMFKDCPLERVSYSRRSSTVGIYTPFQGKTTIKEAFVGKEAVNIPQNLFRDCSALTKVELEEGLLGIERNAFDECSALADINLPSTLTTIGQFAFDNCSAIQSLNIPGSVTTLSTRMCNHCTGLRSIVIPEGVKVIEEFAFYDCSGATTLTLPSTLTEIGTEAFRDCKALTAITCDAVTPPTIDQRTFYNVNKKTCKLTVPAASLEAYKAAPYWKEFFDASGIIEISIDDLNPDSLNASGIIIHDLSGRPVTHPTPGHIYIITTPAATQKAIIK